MTYFSTYDYRNQGEAALVLGYLHSASPPDPVDDLAAAPLTDTSIQLTFTPVAGATSYEYRVDGGSWLACDDASGSQTVTGLTANTSYDFEVRGHNANGYSDPSNTASTTTYTSQAQAFFARIAAQPDTTRKGLYNTLFLSLINNSVYSKLECLWIPAALDAQTGKLNLVSSSYTLVTVNSPTFTVDRGYAGNGSSSYLDTGWNPFISSIFLQNSASIGVFLNAGTDIADSTQIIMGVSPGLAVVPWRTTDKIGARINDVTTIDYSLSITTRLGYTCITRTGSTSSQAQRDNSISNINSTASTGISSGSCFLGCWNITNTPGNFCDNRIAAAFTGSGLSSTDAGNLYSALNTFLTAIGAN